MLRTKSVMKPSFLEAVALVLLIVVMISVSIVRFEAVPHIPILLSVLLLICYGLVKKVSYKEVESGLVEGAGAGMSAVFLFFFIGILVSTWIMSGTIPTLIYAGFQMVTPTYFLAIIFVITAIVGVAVGSSLTTVATVGVAFIGMATVLDVSLPIAAGAIVSGAFFGDKMSPLSDTTNLSASIVGVDLFEHIRNMGWTTFPAFGITLVLFGFLSPNITAVDDGKILTFQEGLLQTGAIHWYTVLPLFLLFVLTILKVPAMMTLAASSLSAILITYFHHTPTIGEVFTVMFVGYESSTGIEEIDELLTRGGMESMMFTISLVLLALSMGGLLFKLGIVQCLLDRVENALRKVASVITASALTAISINILIGEQYLSILLTGQAFHSQYEKIGLAGKNLSRVMEDAGTVVNPLVPWSVCGIFITKMLGVATLDYLPFAFFCLLSPILTVLFGVIGKTLTFEKTTN